MYVVADLAASHYDTKRSFLIEASAADAAKGSLVEEGTATANLGAVRPPAVAAGPVNVVGLLMQAHDYSEDGEWTYDGTLTTATNRPEVDVDIRPFAVYRAEVAVCATQTFDADANGADTDITLGTAVGAADVLGGSFIYEPLTGDIRFVEDHASTTTLDLNTATSADWDTAAAHWIPQRLYGSKANQGLTVSSTKVICEGNETVLWVKVLETFITRDGKKGVDRLNPGIHDNLSASNPKFFRKF